MPGKKKVRSVFRMRHFTDEQSLSAAVYSGRIALIYFLIGCLWIFLSDVLVHWIFLDVLDMVFISILKGLVYVFVTAAIFYFLLFKAMKSILGSNVEINRINSDLRQSNAVLTAVMESSEEILSYALDTEYRYIFFNNSHKETMLHFWGREIQIGDNILDIIKSDDKSIHFKADYDKVFSGEKLTRQKRYKDPEDMYRYWKAYYSPILTDKNDIIGLACFQLDITQQKKDEEKITYLAYHDKLTGLYNRRYFEDILRDYDTKAKMPFTIVVGDFNGLKLVNDAFGHQFGDALLKLTAEVITKVCRAGDIISRWGGDEFLILMPGTREEEASQLVKRMKEECQNYELNAIPVNITFGWSTKEREETRMDAVIKKAEDIMYQYKIVDSSSMRSNTLKTIMSTLHEKNPREEAHSKRVGELCRLIGKAAGLSSIDSTMANTIGFLHDIGKIAIEEEVLNKKGKLSQDEFLLVRQHPEIGYRILISAYGNSEISEAVLAHHENWDGSGYPKGMKGEEIPLLSRIIAIADSYDAMTSERPYRNPVTSKEAIEEIKRCAGKQFDPELVKIFVEKVFINL